MSDRQIIELLAQLKVMSRDIGDYSAKKSLAMTACNRLLDVIGKQSLSTSGLSCNYVIIKKPESAPLSERALPVMVLGLESAQKMSFLRKWIGLKGEEEADLRSLLDWDYYYDRFVSILQKIITIPAIL